MNDVVVIIDGKHVANFKRLQTAYDYLHGLDIGNLAIKSHSYIKPNGLSGQIVEAASPSNPKYNNIKKEQEAIDHDRGEAKTKVPPAIEENPYEDIMI